MSQVQSSHSRRNFIKGAGLAGLAGTLLPGQAVSAQVKPDNRAKNLIFLVVDGMCHGTLGLAHHWNERNKGKLLNWMNLSQRADLRRCTQDTASLNSPVTDSAAAASSWGSGHRVNNGSINTAPDGESLTPLFVRAKRAGKRTGLVTTCTVSHATPAGFAANAANRSDQEAIVAQYLDREIDLLMGGGSKFFTQVEEGGKQVDYFNAFADAGYGVARNREQLKKQAKIDKKLLGIFAEGHMPYAIDRKNDTSLADTPGLAAMFKAALTNLEGSPSGFALQVEAGRVDHAGHANDPGAILHELLEFDNCIPIALDFIEKHPDTMLIVTTDHGTGGCQLDGSGRGYRDSGPALDRINQFKYSFEWLEERFRSAGEFNPDLFREATGITPAEKQSADIQAAIDNPRVNYLNSRMTRAFDDELKKICSVGWTSNNHTSENVDLFLMGAGPEQLPGYIRNNELHGIMVDTLQI
ncbi:hypothetical protein DDZ13_07110 [Coraliomargarita sinensis]|uniref:Alkaline phosphatase n=1 Tax=Coraliomargarita sinensis TaxID=2174842 RepID=A0A317ZFG2_9BACT|nr:alkaline phosphatase [Coraliomargarita sinensis]PXA04295.1 hypothetical protein DDZ13_07110 [Coraliomargarita sinensis]